MTAHCETARSTLYTDPQGRAWESFWLGSGPETTYVFRNQIPDTESWTRTHPGWVLYDGRYCSWQRTPPPRIREARPNDGVFSSEVQPEPTPGSAPQTMTADGDAGFGALVFFAAIGCIVYVLYQRHRTSTQTAYNPHADLDYKLPVLGRRSQMYSDSLNADEILVEEGEALPEGYEWVDDEDASPKSERECATRPSPQGPLPSRPALSPGSEVGDATVRNPDLTPSDPSSDQFSDGASDRPSDPSDPVDPLTHSADITAEVQERIRQELEFLVEKPPRFNIKGISLTEFKEGHCQKPGSFTLETVLEDSEQAEYAKAWAFKFFEDYGTSRIDCCVWWVFGLTGKGGESPAAQRYRQAASFCRACVEEWDAPPF